MPTVPMTAALTLAARNKAEFYNRARREQQQQQQQQTTAATGHRSDPPSNGAGNITGPPSNAPLGGGATTTAPPNLGGGITTTTTGATILAAAAAATAGGSNQTTTTTGPAPLGGPRGGPTSRNQKARAIITVAVRKRPLTPQEIAKGDPDVMPCPTKKVIRVDEPRQKITGQVYIESHEFRMDRVYDEHCKNLHVYNSCIKPLVDAVFETGGRCSCFAYGQTGSGKTHTMVGPAKLKNYTLKETNRENQGFFELACNDLMKWINTPAFREYGLHVSFLEIYCNKVYDLLAGRKLVRALETNTSDGVVVKDLTTNLCTSEQALMHCVETGLSERVVGKNSRNADSSRGHAIFTVEVRHSEQQNCHGKLAFIDLAGSERGADTLQGARATQQDGAGINKSLLALKECIRALDEMSAHVPFRNSELTKVLRDMFIASRSQTLMIANVSPAASCCEQTLNTLRYAERVYAMRQHSRPCIADDDEDEVATTATINAKTKQTSPEYDDDEHIPEDYANGGGSGDNYEEDEIMSSGSSYTDSVSGSMTEEDSSVISGDSRSSEGSFSSSTSLPERELSRARPETAKDASTQRRTRHAERHQYPANAAHSVTDDETVVSSRRRAGGHHQQQRNEEAQRGTRVYPRVSQPVQSSQGMGEGSKKPSSSTATASSMKTNRTKKSLPTPVAAQNMEGTVDKSKKQQQATWRPRTTTTRTAGGVAVTTAGLQKPQQQQQQQPMGERVIEKAKVESETHTKSVIPTTASSRHAQPIVNRGNATTVWPGSGSGGGASSGWTSASSVAHLGGGPPHRQSIVSRTTASVAAPNLTLDDASVHGKFRGGGLQSIAHRGEEVIPRSNKSPKRSKQTSSRPDHHHHHHHHHRKSPPSPPPDESDDDDNLSSASESSNDLCDSETPKSYSASNSPPEDDSDFQSGASSESVRRSRTRHRHHHHHQSKRQQQQQQQPPTSAVPKRVDGGAMSPYGGTANVMMGVTTILPVSERLSGSTVMSGSTSTTAAKRGVSPSPRLVDRLTTLDVGLSNCIQPPTLLPTSSPPAGFNTSTSHNISTGIRSSGIGGGGNHPSSLLPLPPSSEQSEPTADKRSKDGSDSSNLGALSSQQQRQTQTANGKGIFNLLFSVMDRTRKLTTTHPPTPEAIDMLTASGVGESQQFLNSCDSQFLSADLPRNALARVRKVLPGPPEGTPSVSDVLQLLDKADPKLLESSTLNLLKAEDLKISDFEFLHTQLSVSSGRQAKLVREQLLDSLGLDAALSVMQLDCASKLKPPRSARGMWGEDEDSRSESTAPPFKFSGETMQSLRNVIEKKIALYANLGRNIQRLETIMAAQKMVEEEIQKKSSRDVEFYQEGAPLDSRFGSSSMSLLISAPPPSAVSAATTTSPSSTGTAPQNPGAGGSGSGSTAGGDDKLNRIIRTVGGGDNAYSKNDQHETASTSTLPSPVLISKVIKDKSAFTAAGGAVSTPLVNNTRQQQPGLRIESHSMPSNSPSASSDIAGHTATHHQNVREPGGHTAPQLGSLAVSSTSNATTTAAAFPSTARTTRSRRPMANAPIHAAIASESTKAAS